MQVAYRTEVDAYAFVSPYAAEIEVLEVIFKHEDVEYTLGAGPRVFVIEVPSESFSRAKYLINDWQRTITHIHSGVVEDKP